MVWGSEEASAVGWISRGMGTGESNEVFVLADLVVVVARVFQAQPPRGSAASLRLERYCSFPSGLKRQNRSSSKPASIRINFASSMVELKSLIIEGGAIDFMMFQTTLAMLASSIQILVFFCAAKFRA
jgi:hypothetical protein